jgi:EpsD family peptidyl-prolyl cis-trans isomerase
MRSMRKIVLGVGALMSMAAVSPGVLAAEKKSVQSGKTQVVAKMNKREITTSDLRSEMARLGLSPNAQDSERTALDSIVNRALLADAARSARLHRQPEALRRIAVAQEQALAELYLATTSQPVEPTFVEIEDFITANPSLFAKRRIYSFSVLGLPTEDFDQEVLAPLFNETDDFTELTAKLDESGVEYEIAPAVQPSEAFPEPIRKQLAEYGVRDNVVIQSDRDTRLMKIIAIQSAPVAAEAAPALARQALMQQNARTRAQTVLANLKANAQLSYYRETAAPAVQKKK